MSDHLKLEIGELEGLAPPVPSGMYGRGRKGVKVAARGRPGQPRAEGGGRPAGAANKVKRPHGGQREKKVAAGTMRSLLNEAREAMRRAGVGAGEGPPALAAVPGAMADKGRYQEGCKVCGRALRAVVGWEREIVQVSAGRGKVPVWRAARAGEGKAEQGDNSGGRRPIWRVWCPAGCAGAVGEAASVALFDLAVEQEVA